MEIKTFYALTLLLFVAPSYFLGFFCYLCIPPVGQDYGLLFAMGLFMVAVVFVWISLGLAIYLEIVRERAIESEKRGPCN